MTAVFEREPGNKRTFEYEGTEFGVAPCGGYLWLVARSTVNGKAEVIKRAHLQKSIDEAILFIESHHADGKPFCDLRELYMPKEEIRP